MAEHLKKNNKRIKQQIQEAQNNSKVFPKHPPPTHTTKTHTTRCIIFKLLKTKEKEKILKAAQGKNRLNTEAQS